LREARAILALARVNGVAHSTGRVDPLSQENQMAAKKKAAKKKAKATKKKAVKRTAK
jgi:hypothetical protein